MRRIFCLLLLCLCFTTFATAGDTAATAIRAVLSRQSAAWNQGNIEGYMEGYWKNDSLMFIGRNGPTYGWQQTLANYRKSYPDAAAMGQLEFTLLSIQPLSAQYETVVGKWHLTRQGGDLEGYFSLLFRQIKGQWVIVMDHSS